MVPYTVKNPKSISRRSGEPCSSNSVVNFEHVIGGRERTCQFYFYVACYLYVTESFLKIVLLCKVVTVLLVLQDNNAQQLSLLFLSS